MANEQAIADQTLTTAIEVSFAEPVNISREHERALHDVIEAICKEYEAAHPDRVMWVFGYGAKMMCHPMMISDDEPIPFDDSVLSIECAERERYDGERR